MSDPTPEEPGTRIVLIRHGESVATFERYLAGHRTCKGLTDLGRQQAAALAERLARSQELAAATVLVSSHYARARETAEIIAPALGGLGIVEDPGVGEHDPGPICDGLTFAQFIERFGDDRDWEDPYRDNFTGGESISAFHHRVATALHELAGRHRGETVVVACHGGVVDVAFRSFLRLPIAGGFELHTLNTSITEFVRVGKNRWRLARYNDSAHLEALPRETPRPAN